MRLPAISLLGFVALCIAERPAHALGPVDLEAAAKIGFGTNPYPSPPTPGGIGLGGRAGVTILGGLYLGVSFIHYFGGSEGENDYSSTLIGAELGYTIGLIPLVRIRPQLGIGNYHLSRSSDNDQINAGLISDSRLYLEPGVVVVAPIGKFFIVGGDVNGLVLPSSPARAALTFHLQGGVTF